MRVESFYLRQRFLDENEYLRRSSEELEQSSASSSCSSGFNSNSHLHGTEVDSSKLCSMGCGHIEGSPPTDSESEGNLSEKRKKAMEGASTWLKVQKDTQGEKSSSAHS